MRHKSKIDLPNNKNYIKVSTTISTRRMKDYTANDESRKSGYFGCMTLVHVHATHVQKDHS